MGDSTTNGLVRTAAKAIVAAAALVAIVYLVAKWAGDDLMVAPEFGAGDAKELKLGIAVAATAVGGILGVFLTMLARRFTSKPRTAFIAATAVGLVLYGTLAFVRAEAATTAIWLNMMHIAAAVPIVGALAIWLPPSLQGQKKPARGGSSTNSTAKSSRP
ncbi:MAG: DUF6069 family protein [Actinomycetota bacterium]